MKWIKRLFLATLLLGSVGVAGVAIIYFQLKSELPDVTRIQDIKLQVPMQVFSNDGELISQFGEKKRIPLNREDIPDQLVNAFLAIEDSRFYQHIGMDPIGILRAAGVYASSGIAKQGASTITQQVARNFFLTNEKTILRKVREIFLAIQIEQILTKDEILMLYLNKISLGHRSYGVGAAAQVYFGKDVAELTLSEMAVLAGLPKAPSNLNPIRSVDNARMRRNLVLMRMLDEKYITQSEYQEAIDETILSHYHGAEITLSAHYVAEIARNKLTELYGKERSYSEGFKVYTTITKAAQEAANTAVIENLHNYDMRHGYRGATKTLWEEGETPFEANEIAKILAKETHFSALLPAVVIAINDQSIDVLAKGQDTNILTIEWDGLKWARPFISDLKQGAAPKKAQDIVNIGDQIWIREGLIEIKEGKETITRQQWQLSQYPDASAAFVSLNPQNGAVTALVGGYNFVQSKFNRVTQAKRQVGSNIKPFIYSAALDNGYTMSTLVNDTPFNHWTGSAAWRPKNSPATYEGPIRLRRALGQSKNVVSVRLVEDITPSTVIEQLMKFGFNEEDIPNNLSIALGSASATPLEVATGYAIIANGGYKIEPYFIERIEAFDGTLLYQARPHVVCPDCEPPAELCEENSHETNVERNEEACQNPIAEAAISPETAFLTRELLRSAVFGGGSWQHKTGWNGTGWRAARVMNREDMGGKTGTTNDSKDAWFSGFVGNMVATSWVGFDDFNRELGRVSQNKNLDKNQITGTEFGAQTALPAWNAFMSQTMHDEPTYAPKRPLAISTARIDIATGLLTSSTDHSTLFEFFKAETIPTEYAPDNSYIEPDFTRSDSLEGTNNAVYDDELF